MEPIVRFRSISKTYDGLHRVVGNLDLDVAKGEFLTMLGPSGSGKTTTLMMLAGFEAPTSGTITLDGKPLHTLPPYKRDIGVVFQNYALFPHMSIGENIAFPLQIRKLDKPEIERRVAKALEMVRLPGFAKRRPAQASGGQQQRVALARALVFEPKVVLMDEPLGALDRQLREEMQLEIRSIHEMLGITIVYVTHDQGEALTMSDRIAVFSNGRVEQLASPEQLYEAPQNAFVAKFVGENNVFEGRVKEVRGARCEVELAGVGSIVARVGDLQSQSRTCVVAVRPEKISARWGDAGEAGPNAFAATLDEIIYLGDHTKLLVRLANGQAIIVKMPVGTGRAKTIGDRMWISWDGDDCFAFMTEADRNQSIRAAEGETNGRRQAGTRT